MPIIQAIVALLSGDFGQAWELAKQAVSKAGELIGKAATKIGEWVGKGIDAAIAWIKGLPGKAFDALAPFMRPYA